MATSIEDLKQKGVMAQEVALPGFIPGEPFIVELRRPSLMRLAQEGNIPNSLLDSAAKLFNDGLRAGEKDGESFKEMSAAILHLAKAALVKPSYEELQDAGIELTDPQLLQIYMYTQKGVRMLDGFRSKQDAEPDSESGKGSEKAAERNHRRRR